MAGRDAFWQLGGVALIAAAGMTSLLHRDALAANPSDSASALEMLLSLLSFSLASLGALLVINGARLRDDWAHARDEDCAGRAVRSEDLVRYPHIRSAPPAADPFAMPGSRIARSLDQRPQPFTLEDQA